MNGKYTEVISIKDEIKSENIGGRFQYIKALYELGLYNDTISEVYAINNTEKKLN